MTTPEKTVKTEKAGRVLSGRVVSAKMQKTVIVLIERQERHPLYGKLLRRSTRLKVHDEKGEAKLGDLVSIKQSRPISRDKHYVLVSVLEKAPDLAHVEV